MPAGCRWREHGSREDPGKSGTRRHTHHPADVRRAACGSARIRELRIDAQLLKPVQQDALLETIHRVMSRSQGNAAPPVRTKSRLPDGAALAPEATPLHILVAEDNELSAQVLEQSRIRQGHRVRLASNGREVLALAEQGGFDLEPIREPNQVGASIRSAG